MSLCPNLDERGNRELEPSVCLATVTNIMDDDGGAGEVKLVSRQPGRQVPQTHALSYAASKEIGASSPRSARRGRADLRASVGSWGMERITAPLFTAEISYVPWLPVCINTSLKG
jgi:hypothetical protein